MSKIRTNGESPVKNRPAVKGATSVRGPVANLEEHVPAEWWRAMFNHIYLKTDGDVVDDPSITEREVDRLVEILHPQTEAMILDVCCGQGRHVLEFRRRGYMHIEGIDRSRYLINRARRQAKTQGLQVKFREGDARKLPYPADHFDFVMVLGNSFGYFTSVEDDLTVLKEIARVLKPMGTVLLDVTEGDYMREHYEPRSWEWINKNHMVCRERSLSLDEQRLISREIVIHQTRGVLVDQFYAERLYSEEMFVKLLQSAGFSSVVSPEQIKGESTRNHDLGMMGHRLIVTGRIKKNWAPQRPTAAKKVCNVSVIMGDPQKSDSVKPGEVFDDDDHYTINQLKDALRSLTTEGFAFDYLSNHDSLLNDLLRNRPDLVLNLCDEGFNNEARKELHVPAMLEVLGIPYTGGTPQCLSICYDKAIVRGIAADMGIPVPFGYSIKPEDSTYLIPSSFPVIVKPTLGDSGIGILAKNVVYNAAAMTEVIAELHQTYKLPVLVEEFLTGADLTVGILGNPPDDYVVLPIGETDYSGLPADLPPICGYESKWDPESPYWTGLKFIPADLPEVTARQIADWSVELSVRLESRDYVRLDWRCDRDGNPRLLEVNPNPGWCWDGHLRLMSDFDGRSYRGMLDTILKAAARRYQIEGTGIRLWEPLPASIEA